ncbi:FHA domain-containing protein [Micrococcales bacterium KH10]|nr:FHA domain-containing protein [Micrococcales bacterium KH10]
MLNSRYIAGEGAAVIRPNGVVVVATGISDEAAAVLWQRTLRTMVSDAIIAILDHFGHTDIAFANVAVVGRQIEVAVRGDARIELQDSDGEIVTIASASGELERRRLDGAMRVTAMLAGETARLGEGWQVESGLVGAAQVTSIVSMPPEPPLETATDGELDLEALDATVLAESIRAARQGVDRSPADDFQDVGGVDLGQDEGAEAAADGSSGDVRSVVLATGLVVPLDRPVLMGRAPIASRAIGDALPRLVTFDSPQRDISRTHVQVWQAGEHIFVTDLDSTNGVYVTVPDQEPTRIQAAVPMPVTVGTVIEIGEGANFVIR